MFYEPPTPVPGLRVCPGGGGWPAEPLGWVKGRSDLALGCETSFSGLQACGLVREGGSEVCERQILGGQWPSVMVVEGWAFYDKKLMVRD